MQKPQHPRLEEAGPVRITNLSDSGKQFTGRAIRYSDQGLRLLLEEPAPPGTPLRVEWEDSEVLGEVCSCHGRPDGYAIELAIEHALLGTRELARLASQLLGENEPEARTAPVPSLER